MVSAVGALCSLRTSNSKASSSYYNSTSLISSAMEVGETGGWCSVTGPAGRELAVAAPIGCRGKEIALGEMPAAGNSWSSWSMQDCVYRKSGSLYGLVRRLEHRGGTGEAHWAVKIIKLVKRHEIITETLEQSTKWNAEAYIIWQIPIISKVMINTRSLF